MKLSEDDELYYLKMEQKRFPCYFGEESTSESHEPSDEELRGLKKEQKEFPTFYDSTSYNSTRPNVLTKKNKNNNNVNKKDV